MGYYVASQAASGRTLQYEVQCWNCHGFGHGELASAPRQQHAWQLASAPPASAPPASLWRGTSRPDGVLAAGEAPGISPATPTPGAAGAAGVARVVADGNADRVARVVADGDADPTCRMPQPRNRLPQPRNRLPRTRPRLRRRNHLLRTRPKLRHRRLPEVDLLLSRAWSSALSYVTTQVHCPMRDTFLMYDASGQDHRDLVFLFYIHMYDMRWRLESPPPCTVNDDIHCKYLEAPSTGGYQCTMDTLSQSMKLQQLPEADADALLCFTCG